MSEIKKAPGKEGNENQQHKDIENIKQEKGKATKAAMKYLQQLAMAYKHIKYPNVPKESLPKTIYKDATANGLTKCIIDFLTFSGWQADRINNTGRLVDRRQAVTDVLGHTRTIGSVEWIKGTGTNGVSDVSATVAGKSVKIEVKIKADRQSPAQCNYQALIERSGGIYYIAKDFQSFYEWYNKNFTL